MNQAPDRNTTPENDREVSCENPAALDTSRPSEDTAMAENSYAEAGRRAEESARKFKRKIIIVMIAMVVFAAIAIPLISLLEGSDKENEESFVPPGRPPSVIFATPDYDRLIDIRKDPAYLELDRDIYLVRDEVKKAIPEDKISSQSPAVQVLYKLVQALIDGDAEAYNALFSERYASDPKMPELEDPFTMQRIYNIVITEVQERALTDEESGRYTEYLYKLEYCISRNDGTYRVDIGHDTSGSQYFQLTDREGEVLIDALRYLE